ncbi:MAG: hypothetical protein WB791_06265 [Waddliaceae bacterium]
MKFAVSQEQWSYFRQHKTIEFEGLFSDEEIVLFSREVEEGVRRNLTADNNRHTSAAAGAGSEDVHKQEPGKSFEAGHNLWRVNPQIKDMISQSRFGAIVSQLIEKKPLRLGYDQFFPSLGEENEESEASRYREFLSTSRTLTQISSIQGILCGLFLSLSGNGRTLIPGGEGLFPTVAGNGVFFAPNQPIPFPALLHRRGYAYYLIVYVQVNSVYVRNRGDPHFWKLNKAGYQFGDRLIDERNPLIYR